MQISLFWTRIYTTFHLPPDATEPNNLLLSILLPLNSLSRKVEKKKKEKRPSHLFATTLNTFTMAPSAISPPPSTTGDDSIASYRGYDHVQWYVGNAKQAASYYITRMGFKRIAYRGLETGTRHLCSHVVRNGDITFILTSPLRSLDQIDRFSFEEQAQLREIHDHLEQHGDGVKDVAFEVDDVNAVYYAAIKNGAKSVSKPRVLEDEHGHVKVATIQTYGQTTHTLIERGHYHGAFMPGYRLEQNAEDPVEKFLPSVKLERIDHCVGNQDWDEMDKVCE